MHLIHGGDVYSARQKMKQEPLDFSANINRWGCRRGLSARRRMRCSNVRSIQTHFAGNCVQRLRRMRASQRNRSSVETVRRI